MENLGMPETTSGQLQRMAQSFSEAAAYVDLMQEWERIKERDPRNSATFAVGVDVQTWWATFGLIRGTSETRDCCRGAAGNLETSAFGGDDRQRRELCGREE